MAESFQEEPDAQLSLVPKEASPPRRPPLGPPTTFDSGDFPEDWSLKDAKDWLRERLEEGAHCPCCTQWSKIYKRPIHASMARDLIRSYRAVGAGAWFHLPDLPGGMKGGDFGKLRYWQLTEEEIEVRRADGGRSGYWRITPLGERWIQTQAVVRKYAHIYDGQCHRLSGPNVTIIEALGEKFDYRTLMGS